MKRTYILSLMASLLLSSCNEQMMKKAKQVHIRIIETSDVHGAVFPDDLVRQTKRPGSLAQVHAFVKHERQKADREVVLLDNGDILQGTPLVYYYNFEDTTGPHFLARVMNYMAYDAATIGNHDIEAGHPVYDKFRKNLHCELMAANALNNSNNKPYFKPYTILKRKGVKIAVLGLITPAIPQWLPPNIWSGMHFDDMVESAGYWKDYILENEKPDLLVGLFHSGVNAAYGGADPEAPKNENAAALVARKVNGFDIIFAGHDHRISNYFEMNPDGDSTLIIDPAAHAENVGIADVFLNYDENTKRYNKRIEGLIKPMEGLKPDSLFLYKFNLGLVAVDRYVKQPVCVLENKLRSSDALFGPSGFVDLIHQAQLELTGADISFAAPFSLTAVIDSGQLYVRDLFNIYRYENYLYTMQMSGEEIRRYLEYSYALWLNPSTLPRDKLLLWSNSRQGLENPYYNFDSGAGLRYIVDTGKPVSQRVKILSMADGSPFSEDKMYRVAMNSYRGNGGGKLMTDGAGLSKEEMRKRLVSSSDNDFRLMLKGWLMQKKRLRVKALNLWKILPEARAQRSKNTYLLNH